MTKLFTKKPAEEKRSTTSLIRWTEDEIEQVKTAAKIRNLTVSEFIRRAALGRKADVRFETQIVLALHYVVQEARILHKAMTEQGAAPPEKELLELIEGAREAMLRISR